MRLARSLRGSNVFALAAATFVALHGSPAMAASSRWASAVSAMSSQFSATAWSAAQVLGPPDIWPGYGDAPAAWASTGADDKREYLDLSFDAPAPINFVAVFETFHPGAIDSLYAWNPGAQDYELLWTGGAYPAGTAARIWSTSFPMTSYSVSRIRLAINSPAVPGWNEIDAVAIGVDAISMLVPQWASSATASSQYHPTGGYSAMNATGPPNVYPGYGDIADAWASLTENGGREWLQLDYAQPVFVSGVSVVQSATPATLPAVATVLRDTFPTTTYLVDGVRLTLASDIVPGWNEIDAVSLNVDSLLVPQLTASVPPTASLAAGALERARPDPFRGSTELAFTLGRAGVVRLAVYDVRGARVRTLLAGPLEPGRHAVRWNGADDAGRGAAPGLYFMRLDAAGQRSSRRVVRLY
jgi:hypothetical protein